jgi:O-antigen ligase
MSLYYLLLLVERFHDYPRLAGEIVSVGFVPVTAVKIVGLAAVAAALCTPPPAKAAARRPSAIVPLFFAFAVWSSLGTLVFRSSVPNVSLSYLISLAVLLFATRRLACTAERIRNVLRVAVIAGGFAALWCYKQCFIEGASRARGVGLDANYEALALIIVLPLAVWMGWGEDGWGWRMMGKACSAGLLGAAFLTQSRGGLVALAVVGCVALMRARRASAAIAMALVMGGSLAALAPAGLWHRFESIQLAGVPHNGDETSVEARLAVLVAGARMIERHPLLGVGLDRFKALSMQYNPRLRALGTGFVAHDTYVQVAAEAGLPALLLFMAVMLAGFASCRTARRLARDHTLSGIAGAMRLALLAYAVGALFLSAEYLVWYWLLVFLSHNLCEIAADDSQPKSAGGRPAAWAQSESAPEASAIRYA